MMEEKNGPELTEFPMFEVRFRHSGTFRSIYFSCHEFQDPSSYVQTRRAGGGSPCWSCGCHSPSWISHPVLEGEGEEEHLRKGETFF